MTGRSEIESAAEAKNEFFDALGGVTRVASAIGSLLIVGLMVAINLDILGRFLLSAPLPGTAEMVAASIVSIIFLQLPDCIRTGRMIRSDLLFGRIATRSPRIGAVMELLFSMIGLVMLAILTWYVAIATHEAWASHHQVGIPGIFLMPIWPFYALVLVGAALGTLEYLRLALLMARTLRWESVP